ncbi:MAG: 2'-5' RNA ligase family protein [Rubrobacteraceae bacterium]
MEEFERIWEKFSSERRLEFGGHKDPNWRGRYEISAAFVAAVDPERFAERLKPLRDALRPFPFVSPHPDHFMHITLNLIGFLGEGPSREGEVSEDGLIEIGAKARGALAGFEAFPVKLANLNAFPGAAFIEAHDDGEIEDLKDVLESSCGLKRTAGPPHLTLAYFHVPDGTEAPPALISTIERHRNWPVGEIEVREVRLSLLNLRTDQPAPETLTRIKLM